MPKPAECPNMKERLEIVHLLMGPLSREPIEDRVPRSLRRDAFQATYRGECLWQRENLQEVLVWFVRRRP
jgi:hypothetical protein